MSNRFVDYLLLLLGLIDSVKLTAFLDNVEHLFGENGTDGTKDFGFPLGEQCALGGAYGSAELAEGVEEGVDVGAFETVDGWIVYIAADCVMNLEKEGRRSFTFSRSACTIRGLRFHTITV